MKKSIGLFALYAVLTVLGLSDAKAVPPVIDGANYSQTVYANTCSNLPWVLSRVSANTGRKDPEYPESRLQDYPPE